MFARLIAGWWCTGNWGLVIGAAGLGLELKGLELVKLKRLESKRRESWS